MTHTASWASEGKDQVPGRQDGEVGYELDRVEWESR
jgi:hypothetical protein